MIHHDLTGSLEIFMFVHVDDSARAKRVRLATIRCNLGETDEKLDEFREFNSDILNSKRIHGEFTFRHLVD